MLAVASELATPRSRPPPCCTIYSIRGITITLILLLGLPCLILWTYSTVSNVEETIVWQVDHDQAAWSPLYSFLWIRSIRFRMGASLSCVDPSSADPCVCYDPSHGRVDTFSVSSLPFQRETWTWTFRLPDGCSGYFVSTESRFRWSMYVLIVASVLIVLLIAVLVMVCWPTLRQWSCRCRSRPSFLVHNNKTVAMTDYGGTSVAMTTYQDSRGESTSDYLTG